MLQTEMDTSDFYMESLPTNHETKGNEKKLETFSLNTSETLPTNNRLQSLTQNTKHHSFFFFLKLSNISKKKELFEDKGNYLD